MSFKNVLLDFFVSEEASIAQRSALQFGSMLTVVMVVAVTLLAAPQVAHADTCDDCGVPSQGCAWVHQYGTICFGSESWCLWEYFCRGAGQPCEQQGWECRYNAQGCDWGC